MIKNNKLIICVVVITTFLLFPFNRIALAKSDFELLYTNEKIEKLLDTQQIKEIQNNLKKINSSKTKYNSIYITNVNKSDDFVVVSFNTGDLKNFKIKEDKADRENKKFDNSEYFASTIILIKENNKRQGELTDNIEIGSDFANKIPEDKISKNNKDILFKKEKKINLLGGISASAQEFNDYKFAWPNGESLTVSQGWHSTSDSAFPSNSAIDVAPVSPITNMDIIASAPGVIDYMCTGANDQVYIRVKRTTSNGLIERMAYLHVDNDTLESGITTLNSISQGQKFGQMVEGYVSDACGTSNGTHLHYQFPSQSFTIDGVTFSSSNNHSGSALTSTNSGCSAPSTGNWVLTSSCTLSSNTSAPENIQISNNSTLTVLDGVILNVDFINHNITINNGSKLYIENGGKIE